jgi:hypothetical protein
LLRSMQLMMRMMSVPNMGLHRALFFLKPTSIAKVSDSHAQPIRI